MNLNINAATQQNAFLKLSTNVKEAQEAAKANETRNVENQVATNSTLERTAEEDTFTTGDDAKQVAKDALKAASALYVAGFCLGFCPGLFMLATGAFLFSNKGQSFMDKLIDNIVGDNGALSKFQQLTASAQAQNAEAKPAQANQTVDNKVTNPIQNTAKAEPAKEEKQLTPYEKAELRYAKAQEYQAKAAENLEKKEQAQRIADEKLELAEARLEKAQIEYDKAKAEVKMQMTDKMMKLNQSVETKRANANVAKQRTDVAKALLAEAGVKLQKAQVALEDLKAEEIVDID